MSGIPVKPQESAEEIASADAGAFRVLCVRIPRRGISLRWPQPCLLWKELPNGRRLALPWLRWASRKVEVASAQTEDQVLAERLAGALAEAEKDGYRLAWGSPLQDVDLGGGKRSNTFHAVVPRTRSLVLVLRRQADPEAPPEGGL